MTSYTVSEGNQSSLSVCVLVLGGQLARSVPVLLLTSSGSATGMQSNPTYSSNYTIRNVIVMFNQPSDGDDFLGGSFDRSVDTSNSGMLCISISIIDDTVVEEAEGFTVNVSTTDTAVAISPSSATVVIIDNDGEFQCKFQHAGGTFPRHTLKSIFSSDSLHVAI